MIGVSRRAVSKHRSRSRGDSTFNRSGDGYPVRGAASAFATIYGRPRYASIREQCRTGKRETAEEAAGLPRRYLASGRASIAVSPLETCRVRPSRREAGRLHRARVPRLLSGSNLTAEIQACEVVCVNCHRRRTARRSSARRPQTGGRRRPTGTHRRSKFSLAYARLEASGCVDCGLNEICVLDFDHVGRKRANVLSLAREGCSLNV